jgi:putative serine protease PepD
MSQDNLQQPPVPPAGQVHPAYQPDRAWGQPAYYPTTAGGWQPPTNQPTNTPGGGVASAEPKPKRQRTTLIAASTVALALVAGFGGGFWAANLHGTGISSTAGALAQLSTAPTASANLAPPAAGSVEQVAAAVLPSVVSVLSSSSSAEGEGSGVILSADGLILTNNHVIDGASTLQVQFNDGTTATAKVVGADSTDDLAVIKADGVSGLTPAAIGSSAGLQVGQDVVAVGSPLGLSATVTSGIVSALNRPVATSDAQQQTPEQQLQQLPGRGQSQTPSQAAVQATVINAIQTDAAINPGNSGGPLVDMSGKVIGINSAIASLSDGTSGEAGSIGVGFAIPIDQAKRISDEIIATGKASHAVLGASVGDASADPNSLLTTGAKISAVTAGGAAEAAGLKVGDIITAVGDQKVESADALIAAVRSSTPNTAVTITYTRDGDAGSASVTLGSSTE